MPTMAKPKGKTIMSKQTVKKKTRKKTVKKASNKDVEEGKLSKVFNLKFVNADKVAKKDLLVDFIDWSSLPAEMRVPRFQREFSKQIGIGEKQLSRWKNLEGFWDEVKSRRLVNWRRFTNKVYYNGIIKPAYAGNFKAAELHAKMFEGYSEKVRVEDETPRTLSPEKQAEIREALKHIGLETIIKNNTAKEEENAS